jgi:hypothetical protein
LKKRTREVRENQTAAARSDAATMVMETTFQWLWKSRRILADTLTGGTGGAVTSKDSAGKTTRFISFSCGSHQRMATAGMTKCPPSYNLNRSER